MTESIVLERLFKSEFEHKAKSVSRRRVYILPTRYGFLFGFMLCAIFLGAVNYNNSLAYVLTFLLSSVTLIGMFHAYRNMAGLIITPGQAEPIFAGEIAQFPVFIDNRGQPARYSLMLNCMPKSLRWFKPGAIEGQTTIIDLESDCFQNILLPKQSHHRGILEYGRLQITTTFPLGLFRAWSNIDIKENCIVFPAPGGQQPLPQETQFDQEEQSGSQEGNDDFMGLRRYRPGDSSRHLDWKAYAREKGLHRKQFQGFGSRRLLFRWHYLEQLTSTEEILSQLCQWILIAEKNHFFYGLELTDSFIAVDQGEEHHRRCLTALATVGFQQE